MKILMIFLSGLFISGTASAFTPPSTPPDFTCVEESGFTYEFYMTDFQEVHIFDETGEDLGHIDEIYYEVKFLEVKPGKTKYIVRYDDGDNEYAVFTFTDGEDTGSGEITDNDQTMVCQR